LERLRTAAGFVDPGSARKVLGEGWRLYLFAGPAVDDQRILAIEQDALEKHGVDELFNTLEKLQWQPLADCRATTPANLMANDWECDGMAD
jgi:hypothetical protein